MKFTNTEQIDTYADNDNDQDQTVDELEEIEIKLLLEGVFQFYGFDFRNYAFPCVRRRVWHRIHAENLKSVSALQEKVLHDPPTMKRLFNDLSIHVTEMFRDPSFHLSFRTKVIPLLRPLPQIRIWTAGCSTGEEPYSMAILLREENLLDKTRIYATDMNETFLENAKHGVFPLERMQQYTRNYLQAGGKRAFSEYYTVNDEMAKFDPSLASPIVFAQHNLVTDTSFNEFDVIICRNVLIYFNKKLQSRVHTLFYESLSPTGFLGLGSKEGLPFSLLDHYYEAVDSGEKIYRKLK